MPSIPSASASTWETSVGIGMRSAPSAALAGSRASRQATEPSASTARVAPVTRRVRFCVVTADLYGLRRLRVSEPGGEWCRKPWAASPMVRPSLPRGAKMSRTHLGEIEAGPCGRQGLLDPVVVFSDLAGLPQSRELAR